MDSVCFTLYFPAMGWKQTTEGPVDIHIFHSMLWDTKYENHLYKIFHGFILPLFQAIFNEKAPKLSKEAQADFFSRGKWFGEELFTYVQLFGSLCQMHVLHFYVPDKLLKREVAYQTVENDLTRFVKESKKASWPSFSY